MLIKFKILKLELVVHLQNHHRVKYLNSTWARMVPNS